MVVYLDWEPSGAKRNETRMGGTMTETKKKQLALSWLSLLVVAGLTLIVRYHRIPAVIEVVKFFGVGMGIIFGFVMTTWSLKKVIE